MPSHHFPLEHLSEYANGSLGMARSLAVASHLSLCRECHQYYLELESLGGLLLDRLDETAMSEGCLDSLLARLDEPAAQPARDLGCEPDVVLPQPLRRHLGRSIRNLPWHEITSYLSVFDVPSGGTPGKGRETIRLMRIKAGHPMPRHTHGGEEITLVLAGAFSDEHGFYERGDVAVANENIEHRPVAHASGDCICLAVTDAPVRLTGGVGRLLNPFLKF
ncbi:MAG: ChrR family anti-sigma-E factor [Gammaproteobacteria bacterium]|nr:ChrR family anti-sigma-E factor [Gammaproteobacteria bacterium]